MARDIASVADKDTSYEFEARGEPLPLPEGPRSEGGPAARGPDLGEETDPTTEAPSRPSPAPTHEPAQVTADQPSALNRNAEAEPASDIQLLSPEPLSPEQAPKSASEAFTNAPAPELTASWHSAIAEALADPAPAPAPPQGSEAPTAEAPTAPAAPAAELPQILPETPEPEPVSEPAQSATASTTPAATDDTSASFTAAAEGLFRPSDTGPGEGTHLITLGRRLDPSLRIPRPVPPVIEPRDDFAPPVVKPTWKTRLFTFARYAAYAVAGYLALVLVLIVLFRFVDPPGSMLMLTQALRGNSIDRTWVPFNSISPALVRAVIVSEDGRFCEHSGIDTVAMKEAIERAAGGTPRGASTISMQVTKNLFLWNAKSYVRKVIEIPLTLIMELLWPKQRVLEVYLNIAEWGPGVFGAEAAARHHFNKSAARLNEREAALLAAVLPNPVVRVAGSPGPQTSRKARVIQARVKAYGAVASCVVAAAPPASAPAAKPATIRKAPLRTTPRKKKVDDWTPTLNFGN